MTAATADNSFSYPNQSNINQHTNPNSNNATTDSIYSQYSGFFDFNEAGTTPTDSLLNNSDAQFAIPTAGGDYSWSQSDAWNQGNTSGFAIDTDLSSSSSLMQHGPGPVPSPGGAPMVWSMNNYEPQLMVPNTWSVAGSPSPYSTYESSTSPRPSSQGQSQSQSNARTTPSNSRRPSLARYHSSSTTTFQLSPASTIVEPTMQRNSRAEPGRAGRAGRPGGPGRPQKRRKSGHEPREREGSSMGRHQHQQQHPTAEGATPMAFSTVPTPSPKNTTNVPEYSPDSHTSASPLYQQYEYPPQQQAEFPTPLPQQQLHSPDEYHAMPQSQAGFVPPRQITQPQQPPPQALRERNRAAANKCRRKSKAVVADLESTERELAEQHRQLTYAAGGLREEVLALKSELLAHGHCEDDVIQQYFANSARQVGSAQGQAPRGGGSSFLAGPPGSGMRRRLSGFGGPGPGPQDGGHGAEQ